MFLLGDFLILEEIKRLMRKMAPSVLRSQEKTGDANWLRQLTRPCIYIGDLNAWANDKIAFKSGRSERTRKKA